MDAELNKRLDKIDRFIETTFILTMLALALCGHIIIEQRKLDDPTAIYLNIDDEAERSLADMCGADDQCWKDARAVAEAFGVKETPVGQAQTEWCAGHLDSFQCSCADKLANGVKPPFECIDDAGKYRVFRHE